MFVLVIIGRLLGHTCQYVFVCRYVDKVGNGLNVVCGVVGNSLSLLTLCRKNMLKNVSTVYFIGLGKLQAHLHRRRIGIPPELSKHIVIEVYGNWSP